MDTGGLAERLRKMSMEMGADLFGISDARLFLKDEYLGNRPQDVMENCRSVLVLGVRIPSGCLSTLPRGRGEYTNTLMAGTATLRIMAFKLANEIEKDGFLATLVPTEGSEFGYWYADRRTLMGDVSIKYAGFLAGLGNFGLNHLLITKDHGPRVRMTAIMTDAPFAAGEPTGGLVNEMCARCKRCVDICPSNAIGADGSMDRGKCASYMFEELGGLRCGLCVKVCPL
jgi:epoxyqueuosine reductase